MPGQNTLIIASDYNTIQSKIALVMGTGTGTSGYGQSVASNQVGQFSKITVAQWNNLRNDIIRARQHQTGVDIGSKAPGESGYVAGSDLPIPTAARQVREDWRAAYLAMANDAETNRLVAPPPANQATRSDLVTQQVRTSQWNGRIEQTVTVNFGSDDAARYFFNAGGQIEFSSARSGGSAGLKNVTWTTMLSTMGTIAFNYTGVTCTGVADYIGTNGWYEIGTSYELIFEKDAPAGAYAPNKYFIYARRSAAPFGYVADFKIHWWDDSAAPPSFPDPGFGIDEMVDGTLVSNVRTYRATGDNVSTSAPPASTTGIA